MQCEVLALAFLYWSKRTVHTIYSTLFQWGKIKIKLKLKPIIAFHFGSVFTVLLAAIHSQYMLQVGWSHRISTRELHGDKKSSTFPPRTQSPLPAATAVMATEFVPITAVTAVLPRESMLISEQLSPSPPLPRWKWDPVPHYRGLTAIFPRLPRSVIPCRSQISTYALTMETDSSLSCISHIASFWQIMTWLHGRAPPMSSCGRKTN